MTRTRNNGIIGLDEITDTRCKKFQIIIETADGDCERVSLSNADEKEAFMEIATFIKDDHPYSIRKDNKKGLWVTTFVGTDSKRRFVTAKTKAALIDKLYELYEIRANEKTVGDVFEDWLNNKRGAISESSIERHQCDWRRFFVKSGMNDRTIRSVTEANIEDFILDTLKRENLSTKGYVQFKCMIVEIWKRAKRSKLTDIVIADFFDDFTVPKKLVTKNKKSDCEEVFQDDERAAVMSYLREHPDTMNRAILLDFLTGLRCGELAALKKSDYDGDRHLHIQRTETRMGKTVVVDHPKTDAGDRLVYLCKEAVEIIRALIDDPKAADSEWLLIGGQGHRIVRSCLGRRLNQVCDAVDIPRRSMHKIRKTYASHLIDSGLPDTTITREMGHSDIATTRGYYHFSHEVDDIKAARLEKALNDM